MLRTVAVLCVLAHVEASIPLSFDLDDPALPSVLMQAAQQGDVKAMYELAEITSLGKAW